MHLAFYLPVILCLLNVRGALINPSGRNPIRAYGLNQNYRSEYHFTAEIPTNVYSDAWVRLSFPQGFNPTSDCVSYVRTEASYPEFWPASCSKDSSSTYRIEVGSIEQGRHEIYVQGVQNPTGRYGSGTFGVRTYMNDILIDENDAFGDVPLFEPTGTTAAMCCLYRNYYVLSS